VALDEASSSSASFVSAGLLSSSFSVSTFSTGVSSICVFSRLSVTSLTDGAAFFLGV
jgi:hypothetical protein